MSESFVVEFVFKFFLFYLPLLFSLSVHEFAHGWMAKRLGDMTAFYEGRLSLNPLVHVDYLGTVALPLLFMLTNSPIFFGWAKPVPVNPLAFSDPKRDMFWVAFAGPLSNFLLSFAGAFVLTVFTVMHFFKILPAPGSMLSMMETFIFINMLLGAFNMLPLYPLDGAKVLARFLPVNWNIFLEENQNYSYIILIVLLVSGGFYYLAQPVLQVSYFLIFISKWLVPGFLFGIM